jgi:hypothetical protein
MRKNVLLSLTIVIAGLAIATPVSAVVMEQSQSQSQSTSSNSSASVTVTNGSGSGSANSEAKASQSQGQSQRIDMGTTRNVGRGRVVRGAARGAWISVNTDGHVRLSWAQRGGTCNIRYTENSDRGYKYATSAGCDEGGVTIGGLTPGVVYRFQMKQDNGPWSKAIVIKAQ